MLNRKRLAFFLGIFCVIGAVRIISTYAVFNQTYDEPSMVARGMEWLARGQYSHVHHPPLGAVLFALGPYLDGVQINWTGKRYKDGNRVLYHNGDYFRNLSLARLGTLIFYFLTAVVVWLWSVNLFGSLTATFAVLIFTTLPMVLAHSGLATTDMAVTSTLTLAFFLFYRWIEAPSLSRCIAFGVGTGLAFVSKFSALLFLPICVTAILLARWMIKPKNSQGTPFPFKQLPVQFPVYVFVTLIVVWAAYRFSVGSLAESLKFAHLFFKQVIENIPFFEDMLQSFSELRIIPAPEFGAGIHSVFRQNVRGHAPYFLGESRFSKGGSWLFFPVLLAVKTPIPFQIMAAYGIFAAVNQIRSHRNWKIIAPFSAALAMFTSVLPSNINLGLRHLLPIYPLLSMMAAYGIVQLFSQSNYRKFKRISAAGLLLWHLISGAVTHPDYLAYFNFFAMGHPERIVVDSDLDWGQDLVRLSKFVRKRNITKLSLAYFGTADKRAHGLPTIRQLSRNKPTTGWIAISLFALKTNPAYKWLETYEPIATVGKSIRLYYIPVEK
jgi:4-amino-4-deoxy-L-arabinose transferase-like glycosyltransferase